MKVLVAFLIFALFGCAKLNVETKEPIKVDIKMRLDVYQHVVKEVDSIEGQIYGTDEKEVNSLFTIESVYAAEQDPQNVKSAIERRKSRASEVEGYFAKGYIGENRRAYLSFIPGAYPQDKLRVQSIIEAENNDREQIYKATAQKNNIDISQAEKIFFQDHYNRAPQGWWFEVRTNGTYEWVKK